MNEKYFEKKLTKEEMKELLSDYSFGRLSENEKILFENNLGSYPELKSEIAEIQTVFSKVKKDDILAELDDKTTNLSYRVQRKLSEKNNSKNFLLNFLKYSSPVAVLILLLIFSTNIHFDSNSEDTDSKELEIFKSNDIFIFNDEEMEDEYIYDPLYSNMFSSDFNITQQTAGNYLQNASNMEVETYISEMSEVEFINFLEELDNEKLTI